MKSETKRKNIHYKRVVISNYHLTLQELLESALGSDSPVAKATDRKETINADDDSCRLINRHKAYNGMLFGQLVFFESGKSQTFITLDEDAEYYNIDSITSDSISEHKSDDKEEKSEKAKLRKEFIDSILYFGVLYDHVVILQSSSLRARELETHLAWFLGTCAQKLPTDSVLVLKDKPTEATIRKIQQLPVKTVKLGAPVGIPEAPAKEHTTERQSAEPEEEITTEYQAKNLKWTPKGTGVDLLSVLMGADWFDRPDFKDALDDANLKVSLEISYVRKTTRHGQKMLDEMAISLRHMDENDVRIELKGGGTLRGEDLKLSGPISVKTNNGLVDENDLYHQMHAWLVSKVESSEIEVDEVITESK